MMETKLSMMNTSFGVSHLLASGDFDIIVAISSVSIIE